MLPSYTAFGAANNEQRCRFQVPENLSPVARSSPLLSA